MTVGGLAGATIAPDPQLATAPIAAMFLGTALMTAPASLLMGRIGRRAGFIIGAIAGRPRRPDRRRRHRLGLESGAMPAGSAEKRCGLVMDWSHPAADLLPSAYTRWRQSRLGRITDALEQDLVAELVGPVDGRCVLDVGCGDGALAEALARAGAQVTGIDADPHILAAARERLAAARLEAALLQADAQAQPFGDARFDVVVAVTVLCLLRQPERALAEMARVLKPGGRLVIGELGRWSWWAAWRRVRGWLGHPTWCAARFWTPRELQRLVTAAGLEVRTLRAAVFYPPFAPAAGALAPLDPWLGRRLAIGGAFLALLATKPRTGSGR